MNIKRKIFTLIFFTAIIPILIISTITFSIFSKKLNDVENQKIELLNQAIEKNINKEIYTSIEMLKYISDIYSKKHIGFKGIKVQVNDEIRLKRMLYHMKNISKLEKTIKFIAFGTADKEMMFDNLTESQNLLADYDPTTRPWYMGALKSKGVYLSDVFNHIGTGNPIVTLSKKVVSNGNVVGVLVAMVDFSHLSEDISKYKIGSSGSFFIVDKNNNILIDGGDNKKNFSYISKMDLFAKDHFEFIKTTLLGPRVYHSKKIKGSNLLLIGSAYEKDLNSTILKLRTYIVQVVILTIIFILVTLSILNISFDNSLNRLTYIIESISRGNYSKNFDKLTKIIDEKNEFNFIKKAIQKMSYEIIKRENELIYISETDQLTSCYNRRAIISFIEKEIEQSKFFDLSFSLIMFDLDKFKKVNDTFGHLFGDAVLKDISKVILKDIKSTDVFGRYGGEEFLILLPNTGLPEGTIIAERLRKNIEKLTWEYDIVITISVGVVKNLKNDNLDIILERVDNLLYKAKHNGRNRVEYQKIT
ncbi:sensor domain-containing diguanylate cyclase (plasmid) [Fusobacteria bacterium ZRK30]|nr:sensor domain-containing diguanylate cyclase [Fusobacteria bacterium ZRK30]